MSESMSSPWIRDYLIDVAETYGAQLYNAPVSPASKGKKKVQLSDFITCQENSYVWAWISDKDYRISVRISKDAIAEYKRKHGRNVTDCRFFLVFIASYRPMFAPRPLGPKVVGNTPVSHVSLEIGYISFMGTGAHLFGNPRDLESDEKMRTWVLGLREDGGGGNVLKSRKQQELAQKKKVPPSPPSPPSSSLYAPVSQYQTAEAVEDAAKPKHERPQDFKRVYAKRWRKIEVDPWKFATKPAVEERPNLIESNHSLVDSHLDTASRIESRDRGPSVCPSIPRTPPPTSSQRQGTPTNWSPSNMGSPVAADEANTNVSGVEIRQHDEPATSHEGQVTVDTPLTSLMDITETATPPIALQLSKPRLANFVVDFDEGTDLGKGVPIPGLDLVKDIKCTLLRTGRIRTLGEGVEKDGSVYIYL